MDYMLDAEGLTCASSMRKRSLLSGDFSVIESVHALWVAVCLTILIKSHITLSKNSHNSSLRPFRVKADSVKFAAIPVRRESGSKRYSSMDCP